MANSINIQRGVIYANIRAITLLLYDKAIKMTRTLCLLDDKIMTIKRYGV